MKHFQIIESNKGTKLACQIPPMTCAGCASSYADRQHRIEVEITNGQHGHVMALCDLCAKEHLAERKILRIPDWAWQIPLFLLVCLGSVIGSVTFCVWLLVGR